jgi:hypothetical protein
MRPAMSERFDRAAATFPRSDYRPSWLYWSARAHDRIGSADTASARYRLTVADYQNSYYGRLSTKLLASRRQSTVTIPATTATVPASSIPTHDLIRALTAAGLDGVEVRIAHDGLLRSFASPYFNQRTDAYGGTFEKRMRLSIEVLEALRGAMGPGVPLGIRICLDEFTTFGYGLDYAGRYRELPYIGILNAGN